LHVIRTNPYLTYLEPILYTALNTGLRRGELLALRWGNLDLTDRTLPDGSTSYGRLTVESTHDNPTKSRRTRHVPVNRDLRPVLEALRLEALREANATPGAIRERHVFVNTETGTGWVDIGNAWDSALRQAGIAGFRFHDLRHTFATRARRSGMPLEILQMILGHQEITTTMRYAHVGADELDWAINKMCRTEEVVQREGSESQDGQDGGGLRNSLHTPQTARRAL
jgi:integrase